MNILRRPYTWVARQHSSVAPLHLRAAAVAAFVAVAALAFWLTLLPARPLNLDVGTEGKGDSIYLSGVNQREKVRTRTYRWTQSDARLSFPTGRAGAAFLSLKMHAGPHSEAGPLPFALHAGADTLRFDASGDERVYHMLVPPSAYDGAGNLTVRLTGPAIVPEGDSREVALAVDRIWLRPVAAVGAPALGLVLVELLALGALAALLWANRAPPGRVVAGAALGVALIATLNITARYWVGVGVLPMAGVAAALTGASLLAWRLLPLADDAQARFVRGLWYIGLVGTGMRLAGVAMPGFESHDLDIQSIFISRVVNGGLYLYESAHEFAGGNTFYPTGPYLLVLPLLLLKPTAAFALYNGFALVNACAIPLVALIARELGLSRRAALMAAALAAAMPMEVTINWWGFYTNLGGQVLFLLVVWLLLRVTRAPGRWEAALLFISLSMLLVSHVGMLALAGCALAITAALSWVRPRMSAAAWRWLIAAGLAALAAFVLAYLSVVAAPMLASSQGVLGDKSRLSAENLAEGRAYLLGIIPVAIWRGMGMLPFLALLPGLPLLWRAAERPLGRPLLAGWLLSPLIFFTFEFFYLVQVRYVYFMGPLCALALAALLDRLWAYRLGRVVALAALLVIASLGLVLWYKAFVVGLKPSLVPLTH